MVDFLSTAGVFVYTLLIAFFLFGITVFVHEFGHFMVARKCGLVVQTFSIGFGKAIWQWEKEGVVYKIGWIPFGGYVALPQLDPEGMDKLQGKESSVRLPEISPWKKILVALAGPIGNILFAVLLAVIIWLMQGKNVTPQLQSIVGVVETNSAAYASGIRAGDEILAVNGKSVNNWYDFSVETLLQSQDSVVLTLRASEGSTDLTVPVVNFGGGERVVEGLYPATPCIFGSVILSGPADRGGLEPGDTALSFNGMPVSSWECFTELVQATSTGSVIHLVVKRGEAPVELTITPEYNEEYKRMMIGVHPGGQSSMPWMMYTNPMDQLKFDALMIVRVFQALTDREEAPQAAKSLGGPVAIFGMLMFSIKTGLLNTLGLIRLLNVNLAILNLLPIPVLDGGHIVFSLWHGITRRKVNVKMQTILINICAFLLISMMLLVTVNDIDRKVNFKKFISGLISGQTETVSDPVPNAEE